MANKVTTNHVKGSVAAVRHKRKIRLLLWGGAATASDNSAFEFASRNVVDEYRALDKANFVVIEKKILVAKEIVGNINAQDDDSIRSLDIFTHGGPQAL